MNKLIEIIESSGILKKSISHKLIKKNLHTKFIGKNIFIIKKTSSTNGVAKNADKKIFPDGSVFITDSQFGGRGQGGNSWFSSKKSDISMSILLYSNLSYREIVRITILSGLAIFNVLRDVSNGDIALKWPNDILINNKKVCGILCESQSEDSHTRLIIGIGINVNSYIFPDYLKEKATSLYMQNGRKFKRELIISKILLEIENYYKILCKGNFLDVLSEYKQNCASIGLNVIANIKNRDIKGTIIDISKEGNLVIKSNEGEIIHINSSNTVKHNMLNPM